MIHACSFQGGKLSSCPFKTMNYDTFKKKGKVEDKWHRWLGESHSKSFLFCRGGQLLLWPASGNHHASKQDLRYARVSVHDK